MSHNHHRTHDGRNQMSSRQHDRFYNRHQTHAGRCRTWIHPRDGWCNRHQKDAYMSWILYRLRDKWSTHHQTDSCMFYLPYLQIFPFTFPQYRSFCLCQTIMDDRIIRYASLPVYILIPSVTPPVSLSLPQTGLHPSPSSHVPVPSHGYRT